jgi:hypothetical protein
VRIRAPRAPNALDHRFLQPNCNALPTLEFHTPVPYACRCANCCLRWGYLRLRPRGSIRAVPPTCNAITAFGQDKGPSAHYHRSFRLRSAHRHVHLGNVSYSHRTRFCQFTRLGRRFALRGPCRWDIFHHSLGNWRRRPLNSAAW